MSYLLCNKTFHEFLFSVRQSAHLKTQDHEEGCFMQTYSTKKERSKHPSDKISLDCPEFLSSSAQIKLYFCFDEAEPKYQDHFIMRIKNPKDMHSQNWDFLLSCSDLKDFIHHNFLGVPRTKSPPNDLYKCTFLSTTSTRKKESTDERREGARSIKSIKTMLSDSSLNRAQKMINELTNCLVSCIYDIKELDSERCLCDEIDKNTQEMLCIMNRLTKNVGCRPGLLAQVLLSRPINSITRLFEMLTRQGITVREDSLERIEKGGFYADAIHQNVAALYVYLAMKLDEHLVPYARQRNEGVILCIVKANEIKEDVRKYLEQQNISCNFYTRDLRRKRIEQETTNHKVYVISSFVWFQFIYSSIMTIMTIEPQDIEEQKEVKKICGFRLQRSMIMLLPTITITITALLEKLLFKKFRPIENMIKKHLKKRKLNTFKIIPGENGVIVDDRAFRNDKGG